MLSLVNSIIVAFCFLNHEQKLLLLARNAPKWLQRLDSKFVCLLLHSFTLQRIERNEPAARNDMSQDRKNYGKNKDATFAHLQ